MTNFYWNTVRTLVLNNVNSLRHNGFFKFVFNKDNCISSFDYLDFVIGLIVVILLPFIFSFPVFGDVKIEISCFFKWVNESDLR